MTPTTGVRSRWEGYRSDMAEPQEQPTGTDTPTGTDPDAKYSEPGYQDKSLGQAVNQDAELAEELLDETGGDTEEAERRFAEESAGAPRLAEQEGDGGDR